MKERENSRCTIAYLQEFLYKKLGDDIDVLLASNLGVPIMEPTLSMPAPCFNGFHLLHSLLREGPLDWSPLFLLLGSLYFLIFVNAIEV